MPTLNFSNLNPNKKGKFNTPALVAGGIAAAVALYFLGSTLASNINLNSGQSVEFGQGVVQTTSCDDQITVKPFSTFINSVGATSHFFTSVEISNIDGSSDHCGGKAFRIRAYGDNGILSLFTETFGTSDQSDDVAKTLWEGTLPLGSSTITATFPHSPDSGYGLADAESVKRISVETLPSSGSAGLLYGITGAGGDDGMFYLLTPNSGGDFTTQLVGALKYNGAQLSHTTGLAWDPIGHLFYVVSNINQNSQNPGLYKFDPSSASGNIIQVTRVGDLTLYKYPDLAFDSSGQLWGWSEQDDNLVKINKQDATETEFVVDMGTSSTGLTFDNNGSLWLSTCEVYKLIKDSSSVTDAPQMGSNAPCDLANMLTTDSDNVFWTGARHSNNGHNYTEIFNYNIASRTPTSDDINAVFVGTVQDVLLSSIEFTR